MLALEIILCLMTSKTLAISNCQLLKKLCICDIFYNEELIYKRKYNKYNILNNFAFFCLLSSPLNKNASIAQLFVFSVDGNICFSTEMNLALMATFTDTVIFKGEHTRSLQIFWRYV